MFPIGEPLAEGLAQGGRTDRSGMPDLSSRCMVSRVIRNPGTDIELERTAPSWFIIARSCLRAVNEEHALSRNR